MYSILKNTVSMTRSYVSEATDLLKELISIPSISRDEARAADCLCRFLDQRGIDCRRSCNNVWTVDTCYDETRPTLLLNAHIDTVKPAAGWQRDPFTPTAEGDVIYGLGSNDDGASVVSLLQAFRLMQGAERNYNLVFLASAEEEISGKQGVEHALPLLPHIDVALVGEPTGMRPAIAEKGLMVLDVTTRGRAGHAARGEGENAIYKALPDLQWLQTHRFARRSPLLGDVRMTVTGIKAGTQHNVVPAECTMLVDVRPNECYTNCEIFDEVAQGLRFSEVSAHSFRLNPSRIDPQHPLAATAIALCGEPFGSPTLSDQALMPFPSLKMGPGDSARSHTADEYIRTGEIEDAIAKYEKLLRSIKL